MFLTITASPLVEYKEVDIESRVSSCFQCFETRNFWKTIITIISHNCLLFGNRRFIFVTRRKKSDPKTPAFLRGMKAVSV